MTLVMRCDVCSTQLDEMHAGPAYELRGLGVGFGQYARWHFSSNGCARAFFDRMEMERSAALEAKTRAEASA